MRKALADVLFPPVCALCQRRIPASRHVFCRSCEQAMQPCRPPVCQRCGVSLTGAYDLKVCCRRCAMTPPAFDRARAPWLYTGRVREAVHAFKYRNRRRIGERLASDMAQLVHRELGDERLDVVAPVPMHWLKARLRGADSAGWLARAVAWRLARPISHRLVRRRRWTPSQTRLSPAQRRRNVAGAFGPSARCAEGLTVLLVDDVLTSGATVHACAAALRQAGAARVLVLAAACTPPSDAS